MITRASSGEEPFYKSLRFYVSVITPIMGAIIAAYSDSIPWLKSLDQAALNTWLAGLVLTAISFVAGRTFRNVDISGGLAKVRQKQTPLPGRVVGLEVIKADPSQEDGGGPKEPFYTSKRFWTAVMTPIVAAGLGALAQALPEAGTLDPSTVATVIGAAFAAGIGYIIARSARNTKIATG